MFDRIEIKDIRIKNKRGRNCLTAKVFVNGVETLDHKFCVLRSFFKDSHRNQYYKKDNPLPMKYSDSFYAFKCRENKLDFLKTDGLSYFQKKKAKKINKKMLNKKFINISYQEHRVLRNNEFLREKEYSECYFDTCDCGDPGCFGVFNGISISRKKDHFEYRSKMPKYYPDGIMRSKKLLLRVPINDIMKIRKQLSDLAREHKIKYLLNVPKNGDQW